jgi:hypothetical protein
VHASWLNQVEIYFSVVQRKVVSPNDFHTLDGVDARLLDFPPHNGPDKYVTEIPCQPANSA